MDGNLISVIVPIHNGENWLNACFDSLTRQTKRGFDVLAVLDNCTDDSEKIALSYADKLEGLRVYKCNYGKPGATRNVGIEHAKTPFIAFLDCDDYYKPHAIETMEADLCDRQRLVTHRVIYQSPGGEIVENRNFFDNGAFLFGNTYNVEWLRQNDIKFNTCYYGFEDGDFHEQIKENLCYENDNFTIRYCDDNPFYVQMQNLKSITHKKDFFAASYFDYSTMWRYVDSGRQTRNYLVLANRLFITASATICLCAAAGGIKSGDFFRLVNESKQIRELLPPPEYGYFQAVRGAIESNISETRRQAEREHGAEYRAKQNALFRKYFAATIIRGWANSIDDVCDFDIM